MGWSEVPSEEVAVQQRLQGEEIASPEGICREQILGHGNRHGKVPKGRTSVSRSSWEGREEGERWELKSEKFRGSDCGEAGLWP